MDYHLRYMLLQDVEMVQQIDHEAFPTTWPRPRFKREIMSKNARYLVVSSGKPPQISARKELNSDPIDRPSGLKSWITGVINQLKNRILLPIQPTILNVFESFLSLYLPFEESYFSPKIS